MIPENITKEHMLKAIRDVDSGIRNVSSPEISHDYCLVYSGERYKHFPPKVVIKRANLYANGHEILYGEGIFYGGKGKGRANSFCGSRGFVVIKHGCAPH